MQGRRAPTTSAGRRAGMSVLGSRSPLSERAASRGMRSTSGRSRLRPSSPMGRQGRLRRGRRWRIRLRCWAFHPMRRTNASDVGTGNSWLAIIPIGQHPARRSSGRLRMSAWPASRQHSGCSTIQMSWNASVGWSVLGDEGAAQRSQAETGCTSGRRTLRPAAGSNLHQAILTSTTAPALRASSR
jgi:hypothetical protein